MAAAEITRAEETGTDAPARSPGSAERAREQSWGDLLKAFLAVHVARAASRVVQHRAATPVSGRLGGEVRAAARPVPPPASRTIASAPRDKGKRAEEACVAAGSGTVPIARAVFKEFGKDNGTLMAASVAFYLVLSLVPLLAVGVAIIGQFVGGNEQAMQQVFAFLKSYFSPQQQQMVREIVQGVVAKRGDIAIGGLVGLIFTATGGFATLDTAINITWGMPQRNFIKNKLFALLMMVVVGALFALSFGLTASVSLATTFADRLPFAADFARSPWIQFPVGLLIPLLISSLMFTAIYYLFPNTKEKTWKPALISGVITAVLWELFKQGYTWYSSMAGDQSATYGSLAGFVGLVMWIYYTSALILLGSELTWTLNGCPGRKPEPPAAKKEPPSA